MTRMNRTLAALLGFSFLAAPSAAFSHATLEVGEAPVGSTYKAVFRIGHGCDGEATLKVRVQVPEGFVSVKPQPKAGWELATVKGKYAKSYTLYGHKVGEGVKEVVWTGSLLDEHYDEFVLRGTLAADLEPGKTFYIPVVQECATKADRWIQIPAEGQDAHSLEYPAPGVKLLEKKGGH